MAETYVGTDSQLSTPGVDTTADESVWTIFTKVNGGYKPLMSLPRYTDQLYHQGPTSTNSIITVSVKLGSKILEWHQLSSRRKTRGSMLSEKESERLVELTEMMERVLKTRLRDGPDKVLDVNT